jgi:hypothetical protein
VSGEPLAPRRGIPSGRGPRTVCWRQGSGADGLPFIRPFPSAIAEGRRLALPPDGRRRPLQAPHTVPTERCWTPAGRHNERPGSLKELGKGPGASPPRSPAPNIVNWELRDSFPGMVSASMGSVFCLLTSSSFCPSSFFPGELRAFALPGAPLLPLPSGTPLLPRHPGAMGGRRFPPSLFGRGMMVPIHHPSRGGSRRTRRGPGAPPPSSGRPRRGGAAPAFVGAPNSSPSAPRALAPGTGTP